MFSQQPAEAKLVVPVRAVTLARIGPARPRIWVAYTTLSLFQYWRDAFWHVGIDFG